MKDCNSKRVIIRGGGDLSSGVIQKLWRSGFQVLVLEIEKPLTIRRSVALSSAVMEKEFQVEDMKAVKINSTDQCQALWDKGEIPVLVDPDACAIQKIKPVILVDAVIAKKNIGTKMSMAPITIALGPGYTAGRDVDIVVETARGHNLGRIICEGQAMPNTGVPGIIAGESFRRVIRADITGKIKHTARLGDFVEQGQAIMLIGDKPVPASLSGVLRGLIAEYIEAYPGLKIADIDPRSPEEVDWKSISDKARNIGGAVLEACFYLASKKGISLLN